MTWNTQAFPWKNPVPVQFYDSQNNTVESLPDEADDSDFDEDDFLGSEDGITELPTVEQPQTSAPVQQPTQTTQPPQQVPTQDPQISSAFAEQRRYFEQQLQLQQQQNQLLMQQLQMVQQPQQPQTQVDTDPMPDPVDEPEAFGAWSVRQAVKQMEGVVAPVRMTVEQQQQHQAQLQYQNSVDTTAQQYGENWQAIYDAAGRFAAKYPSVVADVLKSPNPGKEIAELGMRELGQRFDPISTPALPSGQAQPLAKASYTAAEVQAMLAQATGGAVQQMKTRSQSNGYNLATPTVSAIPAQVVKPANEIKPGSPEEDALLGQ